MDTESPETVTRRSGKGGRMAQSNRSSGRHPLGRCARPAFTIVELIVVILIIIIISAILLPALGGARNVAKKTATQNLIQQLLAGAARFEQDQRRLPGYFSPTEMGNVDQNPDSGTGSGRGMSAMENIMLDLAGGIVLRSTGGTGGGGGGGSAPPEIILPENLAERVGPIKDTLADRVDVDTSKIGVSYNGFAPYFVPDNKFYQPQFSRGSDRQAQNSAPPHSDMSTRPKMQLPDVIDAFGVPILAWVMDDTATQPIATEQDFARKSSGAPSGAGTRARFYWNSNSAFLSANAVGPKFVNMPVESLIGSSASDGDRNASLTGLLGNPGYPDDRTKSVGDILPTAARGRFIIHSAGVDGVYLGRKDDGAKHAIGTGTAKKLSYGLNFKNKNDTDLLDSKDQPTTIDVLEDFDDIVVSGGN